MSRTFSSLRSAALSNATLIIAVVTVVIGVVAAFLVEGFATVNNIRGLFLSVSLIGIIAVGLSLVTISGSIFTLSIPALTALSTIVFVKALELGPVAGLLICLGVATLVGLIQGLIVGRFRGDPIITTIATSAILIGIAQQWTGGRTIIAPGGFEWLNIELFGAIPLQTAVFILVTLFAAWLHRKTVLGRRLTLIGLNPAASRVGGVESWPYIVFAFAVSGVTTGLAAAFLAAQSGQGTLLLGANFGFAAIVAVVVGGVAIQGGVGSPIGAAIGAVFVGLLENVLTLSGTPYEVQLVVKGVLVLGSVIVMGLAYRKQTTGGGKGA